MLEISEKKKKKLRIWIRKINAHYGQIDILVEDHKAQQANKINTQGLRAQIDYLTRYYKPKSLRHMIWGELTMLQKHGMKRQSKNIPENNIAIAKRKKAKNHENKFQTKKKIKKSGKERD